MLPHRIDTINKDGWLWYSHDRFNPPSDRQYVSGDPILKPKRIGLAAWYFLSDDALAILGSSTYSLHCNVYDHWHLTIDDRGRAALFKLRFL